MKAAILTLALAGHVPTGREPDLRDGERRVQWADVYHQPYLLHKPLPRTELRVGADMRVIDTPVTHRLTHR